MKKLDDVAFQRKRSLKVEFDKHVASIPDDEVIGKKDLYLALRDVYVWNFVRLLKPVIDKVPIR